jgi:hypothetical protein
MSGRGSPRALLDRADDRRLRRDGFVVFPLLGPEDVSRARAEFARLHGWKGRGFHADLNVPDPAYRREVGEVLSGLLADRVTACFDGYRPFLYNFLCKFPGADSELYLHRDWMYVDERQGDRTYVAWIALEDVAGDNGRLQVLPGSHRLDDRLRGSRIVAPWIDHEDVIRPRLRSLSVRAGDCVVLDNALVHCSLANLADEPRLVAAVGMRPLTAPLVHFRRVDDSSAAFHRVEEDFFCTYTPADLERGAPPVAVETRVPAGQRPLSERHLATIIDHPAVRVLDRLAGPLAATVARRLGTIDRARVRRGVRRAAALSLRRVEVTGPGRRSSPSWPKHLDGRTRSIVVVSTWPDDRPSTRCLHDIVAELRLRPGVRVSSWFLRSAPSIEDWPGARVVDGRRWLPARVLSRLGGPSAAAGLQAARRHVWRIWLSRRADVVIYDDGVGARFLPPPSRAVRVVRRNARLPAGALVERPVDADRIDLTLVAPGAEAVHRTRRLDAPFVLDWEALLGSDLDAARSGVRQRLGLDDDAIVVVGTGRDGWLDGPELFVRALWELERGHAVAAHGVWSAPDADHHEIQRLRSEADRCGLGGRVRFLTTGTAIDLLCGDVGLLPCRTAGDACDALALVRSGIPVVTFPVWGWEDPAVITVPHLDLVAAADAIATALTWDRAKLRAEAEERIEDLATWVDRFLDAVAGCRA